MKYKKIVLLTMGEPAGIGPELCIHTSLSSKLLKKCTLVIIGDINILKQVYSTLDLKNVKFNEVQSLDSIKKEKNLVNVFTPKDFRIKKVRFGYPTIESAKASFNYIKEAVRLISSGWSKYLVTAPISKEAWKQAKIPYTAHTEALGIMTKAKKYAMIFVNPFIKVVLVTRHIALKDVSKAISRKSISEALEIGISFLNDLGIKKKNIGICNVNPHAGERGAIGKEEINKIEPVISNYKSKDIKIIGPESCDSIFNKCFHKELDLVIAMYHDQGILPLKILSYFKCVNITYGLPLVRTSPGHGVALDIAGKNIARSDAMEEAVNWAIDLGRKK